MKFATPCLSNSANILFIGSCLFLCCRLVLSYCGPPFKTEGRHHRQAQNHQLEQVHSEQLMPVQLACCRKNQLHQLQAPMNSVVAFFVLPFTDSAFLRKSKWNCPFLKYVLQIHQSYPRLVHRKKSEFSLSNRRFTATLKNLQLFPLPVAVALSSTSFVQSCPLIIILFIRKIPPIFLFFVNTLVLLQ